MRKFIYGPGLDEPICLLEVAGSNAVCYYHFDGLGSVVALSDVNSVLVERYTYDVFGRPTIRDANGTEIAASAFANPYLFTGRVYDAETGLYYYRARYYDYATGRFLQPDPTGYTDGLNLYAYVGDNPVRMVDPSGLLRTINISMENGQLKLRVEVPITYIPYMGASPEEVEKAGKRFDAAIESGWTVDYGLIAMETVVTHPGTGQTNMVYVCPPPPYGRRPDAATLAAPINPLWVVGRVGVFYLDTTSQGAAHEGGHFMGLGERYDPATFLPWSFYSNNIVSLNPQGVVEPKTVIELLIQELYFRLLVWQKAQQKGCE